jgi:hypothetical protein
VPFQTKLPVRLLQSVQEFPVQFAAALDELLEELILEDDCELEPMLELDSLGKDELDELILEELDELILEELDELILEELDELLLDELLLDELLELLEELLQQHIPSFAINTTPQQSICLLCENKAHTHQKKSPIQDSKLLLC